MFTPIAALSYSHKQLQRKISSMSAEWTKHTHKENETILGKNTFKKSATEINKYCACLRERAKETAGQPFTIA
jgi:hypothetical protein